jgi:multidrug efflux system membrane fusion protein
VPIHAEGIGTVQAFNSVLVRARVDGQLDSVTFTQGQDVKAGDVLAQIDPRPYQAALAQAKAAKAKTEALLGNARLDLQRYTKLAQTSAATQQSVDTQKSLVGQLEATLQADEATIENADVQLGYTTIRAPFAGRTGLRLIDPGNMVRAADLSGIVVIAQLQPIYVAFSLPQQVLPGVKTAESRGQVPVTAFDSDRDTLLAEGLLSVVDNQIDPQTGTVKLRGTFLNADGRLWPGQFVNVRLQLDIRMGATVVPAPAIQRNNTETFVFVIAADQTIEVRPVRVGHVTSRMALVESGLEVGEGVVVTGQDRLRQGSRVVVSTAERAEADPRSTPKLVSQPSPGDGVSARPSSDELPRRNPR